MRTLSKAVKIHIVRVTQKLRFLNHAALAAMVTCNARMTCMSGYKNRSDYKEAATFVQARAVLRCSFKTGSMVSAASLW